MSYIYLYWIVSDVVEARSLVIRILTMLKRKMKLICWEDRRAADECEALPSQILVLFFTSNSHFALIMAPPVD